MSVRRGARHAILVALVAVACGPIVMIPGGRLSGQQRSVPSDWSYSDEIDTVQLETRPADPYSVNVWGVAANGAFYVMAGDRENRWVQHIADDPAVRLKVRDDVFELRAVEVTGATERDSLIPALSRKYGFTPDAAQLGRAVAFRLDPR